MVDLRSMRSDSDIGAWGRRWSSMHRCCAGTISLAVPFDMTFIRHGDGVAYVR